MDFFYQCEGWYLPNRVEHRLIKYSYNIGPTDTQRTGFKQKKEERRKKGLQYRILQWVQRTKNWREQGFNRRRKRLQNRILQWVQRTKNWREQGLNRRKKGLQYRILQWVQRSKNWREQGLKIRIVDLDPTFHLYESGSWIQIMPLLNRSTAFFLKLQIHF